MTDCIINNMGRPFQYFTNSLPTFTLLPMDLHRTTNQQIFVHTGIECYGMMVEVMPGLVGGGGGGDCSGLEKPLGLE